MPADKLINAQILNGVWKADLAGAGQDAPDLQVMHLGQPVMGLTCEYDTTHDVWHLALPIPSALVSDGVQTFAVKDNIGATIGSFSLIVGEVLAEDLHAEVALLRNELEVLKKAFRSHCAEG